MLKMVFIWIPATGLVHSRSLLGTTRWSCEVWTYVCLMVRVKMLMGTLEGVTDVRTGAVNISREGTAG